MILFFIAALILTAVSVLVPPSLVVTIPLIGVLVVLAILSKTGKLAGRAARRAASIARRPGGGPTAPEMPVPPNPPPPAPAPPDSAKSPTQTGPSLRSAWIVAGAIVVAGGAIALALFLQDQDQDQDSEPLPALPTSPARQGYSPEFRAAFMQSCGLSSGGQTEYCRCALDHLETTGPNDELDITEADKKEATQACLHLTTDEPASPGSPLPQTAKEAAGIFYKAWTSNDRLGAASVGTKQAVTSMFDVVCAQRATCEPAVIRCTPGLGAVWSCYLSAHRTNTPFAVFVIVRSARGHLVVETLFPGE